MVDSADAFAEFIKAALEAEIQTRVPLPADPSRVVHGEARIGDTMLFFADSGPNGERGPQSLGSGEPSHIHLWATVADPEAAFTRAVSGGAHPVMEPTRQEDGSRMGGFVDPWGTLWWVTAPA
jgi:PhnB protein